MRVNKLLSAVFVSNATLVACSTVPEQHSGIDAARSSYQSAQGSPDVTKYAPVELQQAGNALKNAEDAWRKNEDEEVIDHLAYIAKQRAVIAQDTGQLKATELTIANVRAERDKIRLTMRTEEADAASKQVEAAQQTAMRKAEEAAAAKMKVAAMEAELAELNAKKSDRGMVVTLGDILFEVDKAEIKPGAERNVEKIADFLREYPERKAVIEGFTDSTGSDDHNQSLSQRRADAVRVFLINKGVDKDRIAARGYGETNPVASNDTPATRQLNRRVEVVLSDDSDAAGSR